jgi:hypothetical protein
MFIQKERVSRARWPFPRRHKILAGSKLDLGFIILRLVRWGGGGLLMVLKLLTCLLHGAESFLRSLVKKFPAFYGNRRFITAFTSVCHLSATCPPPVPLRSPCLGVEIYHNINIYREWWDHLLPTRRSFGMQFGLRDNLGMVSQHRTTFFRSYAA